MDDRHAKPGDIIRISYEKSYYFDTEALVLEWSSDHGVQRVDSGEVCCSRHNSTRGFYLANQYVVVRRGKTQQAAQPQKSVDKPSKTLRDDIFRSIFE